MITADVSNWLKVLEWNVHAMGAGGNYEIPDVISKEIHKIMPDIVVLTEFYAGKGGWDAFREEIREKYSIYLSPLVFESPQWNYNQVAILLRRDKRIAVNQILCLNPANPVEPEFLRLDAVYNTVKFSIVGIRIKTQAGKKEEQLKFLSNYIDDEFNRCDYPFLCCGDFNVKPEHIKTCYPVVVPDYDKKLYGTPNYINNYSIFFTGKNKIIDSMRRYDYMIANHICVHNIRYSWDYIKQNARYPCYDEIERNSTVWDIVGFPDHAMLIADIEINEQTR